MGSKVYLPITTGSPDLAAGVTETGSSTSCRFHSKDTGAGFEWKLMLTVAVSPMRRFS